MKKLITILGIGISSIVLQSCFAEQEVTVKPPTRTVRAYRGDHSYVPIDLSTGRPLYANTKREEKKAFKNKYRRSAGW